MHTSYNNYVFQWITVATHKFTVTIMCFVKVGVAFLLAIATDACASCIPATVFPHEAGIAKKVMLLQQQSINRSGSMQSIRW